MGIPLILGMIGLSLIALISYGAFWHSFLSPLAKFPGPKLAVLTLRYEFYFDVLKEGGGQYLWEIERMHNVYGKLVGSLILRDKSLIQSDMIGTSDY